MARKSDELLGKRHITWDEYISTSGFIGKLLSERTSGEVPTRHAFININGRILLILQAGEEDVGEWDITDNTKG